MKLKLTKKEFRRIVTEEVNALTGLKEETPLEEFLHDFRALWDEVAHGEKWGPAMEADPAMKEEVFHAVLKKIKEDLGLMKDSGTYF